MGAQKTAASPTMSESVPRPRIVAMAAASSRPGMARPRSVKRMSTEPAKRRVPAASEADDEPAERRDGRPTTKAVKSVSCPPATTRASRSRPLGSVPSGWPAAPTSSGSPVALRAGGRFERRVDRPDERDDHDADGQQDEQADADAQAPALGRRR